MNGYQLLRAYFHGMVWKLKLFIYQSLCVWMRENAKTLNMWVVKARAHAKFNNAKTNKLNCMFFCVQLLLVVVPFAPKTIDNDGLFSTKLYTMWFASLLQLRWSRPNVYKFLFHNNRIFISLFNTKITLGCYWIPMIDLCFFPQITQICSSPRKTRRNNRNE